MMEQIYTLTSFELRDQTQKEGFTASIGAMSSSWAASRALREELLEPSVAWTLEVEH